MSNKVYWILILFILISCSPKNKFEIINIDGNEYVSVFSYGAKCDENVDSRKAIQRAFNSVKRVYFPKGKYLIGSKTASTSFLLITEKSKVESIVCEEGAELILSNNLPTDYIKPAVIAIIAQKGDIKIISIDGLKIDGKRALHNLETPGILAYEVSGHKIREFILSDINIENTGGGGIHTQASYNDFKNIHTKNCGNHGIGIINTTNNGSVNEFYLDGYISIDDDAYSIDFSGLKKDKIALPGYSWKGVAKNIRSVNSFYGIKTAGYWDLKLENVSVENSAHNGFFINVDAPGKNIEVVNLTVKNANGNGLALIGETNFKGKNITVEGCKVGVNIGNTLVDIDSLVIDSKYSSLASLRITSAESRIKNFMIKNSAPSEDYVVWLNGKKAVLQNGQFINNQSKNEIIIHENAEDIILKNLYFDKSNSRLPERISAITNIQKKGKTQIIDCDFSNVEGRQIVDRNKKSVVTKSKGYKKGM